MPIQNDGMEIPAMDMAMTLLLKRLFGYAPDHTPSGMPRKIESTMATATMSSVAGSRSVISASAGRWYM